MLLLLLFVIETLVRPLKSPFSISSLLYNVLFLQFFTQQQTCDLFENVMVINISAFVMIRSHKIVGLPIQDCIHLYDTITVHCPYTVLLVLCVYDTCTFLYLFMYCYLLYTSILSSYKILVYMYEFIYSR